jgi:hypothetical protein
MKLASAVYEDPHRWLAVLLTALVTTPAALIFGAMTLGGIGAMIGFALSIFLTNRLLTWFGGTRSAFKNELEIDEGVLRVPTLNLTLRPNQITSGLESIKERSVVLDLEGTKTLRLRFAAGDDAGKRLLGLLGAAHRTTRVPLRRELGRFTIGLLTFFFGSFAASFSIPVAERIFGHFSPGAAIWTVLALTTLLTVGVVRRFGAPHVVIGSDGIRVRGMWSQPFISYSDIERVDRSRGLGITLHLRNGSKVNLPVVAIGLERVTGLIERIEKARKSGGDGRSRIEDALARAGKSIEEWHRGLTEFASRQATFREAAFEPHEIEGVLANPNANAEQRIGAAFVLHRIDPAVARTQVRIAADATADEDLRDALLAAAEGEMDSAPLKRRVLS